MRSVSELEGHEVMQRGMHNTAYLLDEFKIDPALAVSWFDMKGNVRALLLKWRAAFIF